MNYINRFRQGLRFLRDQRGVFEIYVRSVLEDMSVEVSKMLLSAVVFQWRKGTLGVYCPTTGFGRDFAKLTVLDGHGDNNQWTPILRLEVTLGGGDGHWEIDSDSLVEDTFAGMLQYPPVAKMLAHLGKLRSDDQSRFVDIALPLPGED